MPSKKTVADIKKNLLAPATTSHFEVEIPIPPNAPPLQKWAGETGGQNKINLMSNYLGDYISTESLEQEYKEFMLHKCPIQINPIICITRSPSNPKSGRIKHWNKDQTANYFLQFNLIH